MRILQTAHSYPPDVSGVGMVVSRISAHLAAMGHEVHVATAAQPVAPARDTLDGVIVHRFPVRGNQVAGMHGDVNDYRNFVLSGDWDAVLMHCAQTWSTDVLLPHLDQLHCGRIFVGHGLSALDNPAYRPYFASLGEQLRLCDRIFTLSPLLEESEFCRRHKLREPVVVPNGVDLEEWEHAPLDVRTRWNIGRAPWILSVSNHSTVKRHSVFANVFKQLRTMRPDTKATIVGGHYPAARWRLGRYGIQGGCWYGCRAKAWLQTGLSLRSDEPRTRVVSAIREADVVLITSSREASPLVVLECMAAGTPWVSLDVGCVRENSGGIVVSSPEQMVSITAQLLQSPECRRELGRQGRQAAIENHNWNMIARLYEHECLLASWDRAAILTSIH